MKYNLTYPLHLIFHWRYWPKEILYFPLFIRVFIFGAMRTGRFFYFSSANPDISLGGFAGDSKFNIIKHIPNQWKPKTILIPKKYTITELLQSFADENFVFPVITKPDIGEGGFLVTKINSLNELKMYHTEHNMNYLIQEFIDLPMEFSVLVHDASGTLDICSLTERKYITFSGDGISTIQQLIRNNPNSKFRQNKLNFLLRRDLNKILKPGEKWMPICIGNWDYGASYYNCSNKINSIMKSTFQSVNAQIGLFHVARYDIKCKSLEELSNGEFKILEINGVKGEPIHIYDLNTNIIYAYKEIFKHWNKIMIISRRNMKIGFEPENTIQAIKILYRHLITKKLSLKAKPNP